MGALPISRTLELAPALPICVNWAGETRQRRWSAPVTYSSRPEEAIKVNVLISQYPRETWVSVPFKQQACRRRKTTDAFGRIPRAACERACRYVFCEFHRRHRAYGH